MFSGIQEQRTEKKYKKLRSKKKEMAYVIEAKSEKAHLACLPLRLPLRDASRTVEIDRAREDELETLRGLLNHVITEGLLLFFIFLQ